MRKFKRCDKLLVSSALTQIFLLVMMTVAISFVISSEAKLVSAQTGQELQTLAMNEPVVPITNAYNSPMISSVPASQAKTTVVQLTESESAAVFGDGTSTSTPGFGSKGTVGRTFSGDQTILGVGGQGTLTSSLLQGLAWGGTVALLVQFVGPMLGLSKENTNALSTAALIGGIGAGIIKAGASSLVQSGSLGGTQGFIGTHLQGVFGFSFIAITAIVFILMYKDTETQKVIVSCLPWEPVLGGNKCEECNGDPLRPCSEYRCKALGQACDIVNKGTTKEQCVWIAKGDVTSPTITPWAEPLSRGLRYNPLPPKSRPTALGTGIVRDDSENQCLPAFTALQFGLITNEVAQCKLDYSIKNYSEMQFYFGESNYYETNHTQKFKLPSPKNLDGSASPLFQNDGTFTMYIRCQDANGNVNVDAYAIEFCVDESPDATAPVIESTSIISGSPVRYNVDSVPLEVNVNEPSECKWSRQNIAYPSMENMMQCSNSISDINGNLAYPCLANLTGIENDQENVFYFRCQDTSENQNTMTEGYKFSIRGSTPLDIIDIQPNETVIGSSSIVPTTIQVTTDDGSDEGRAKCFYNNTYTNGFTEMAETGGYLHKQLQDYPAGVWSNQIKCVDAGGNVAEKSFSIEVKSDTGAPIVTRAYRDTSLKIVTNEDAECSYSTQSCNFNLIEGLKMQYLNLQTKNALYAPWENGKIYYVKCRDEFGNQPIANECSVIVSPRSLSGSSDNQLLVGGSSSLYSNSNNIGSATIINGTRITNMTNSTK